MSRATASSFASTSRSSGSICRARHDRFGRADRRPSRDTSGTGCASCGRRWPTFSSSFAPSRTSAVNSTDATHRRSTSAPYFSMPSTRADVVAGRLVHRAAVLIDDPARRDDLLVGRMPFGRDRGDEARAEPAAILIAAFEIHVGRPRHAAVFEHRAMRDARLEPDVDDVHLFGERRARALRAREARRQERLDGFGPPHVARRRCESAPPRCARRPGRGSTR